MTSVVLYLIRHARAAEQGDTYPDDSLRPLSDQGETQAQQLASLLAAKGIRFDWLISSPYTRARQTAAPLVEHAERHTTLETLATADYTALLRDVHELLTANALRPLQLALVGHEPYLSELASHLLTGDPDGVFIDVKKAALLCFRGKLAAGEMTLEMLVPYGLYQHL
jgi:phosphohistidine phosphatase